MSVPSACGILLLLAVVTTAELKVKVIPNHVFPKNPTSRGLANPPLNEWAFAGSDVILTCEADGAPPDVRIHWWEFVTNEFSGQMVSDNNFIVPSHPNSARYSIIQTTSQHFHLQIRDVRIEDGGSYVCLDGNSAPPNVFRGQAELIVLQSNTNATTQVPANGIVIEGQNYTKSAFIQYKGGLTPTMTWTGPEPYREASVITDRDVFSGIAITCDRGMDGKQFVIQTNFTRPAAVPEGVADNAPTYNYVHTYQLMFVYWGPQNMYAVPAKPFYEVGDQITCYADAFPSPFYLWQHMGTLVNTNSQVYTVVPSDVDGTHIIRCQAQNLIQGFLYTQNLFYTIYVPAPTTTPTTPTTPPTTPAPAEANCDLLTGWWMSYSPNPYAEMFLTVAAGQTGRVTGFMRNDTDQQWVEIVGRTRTSDYSFLGMSAIWPYEVGVTGMAGECHKCFGVEVLMTAGNWRASFDSHTCGDGGTPSAHTSFEFYRVRIGPNRMHHPDFKVYRPTKEVSGALGLKHLKYD